MDFKPFSKLLLVVLDGFGIATPSQGNAITLANPPTINDLINRYPAITLQSSGPSVGLPWGEMGNSEVGHLNIGAGRIIGQDLSRITMAIEDRSFFSNEAFLKATTHVKENESWLHIAGLVSPGGVHSWDEHLYALLGLAKEQGVKNVAIHMYLDGRDTPPQIALDSLDKLNRRIRDIGVGSVATISGRFYAMDRAEHWNLTEQAYRAMVFGEGPDYPTASAAISSYYRQNIFDEMIPPTVIKGPGQNPITIKDHDALILFNFRSDRMVQMSSAFARPGFSKFSKPAVVFKDLVVVTMTEYTHDLDVSIAFPPVEVINGLAEIFSKAGIRQYHAAESEKYAHVTVFFNGGVINPFPGEDREIVTSPSSNYQNYVDVPEMSAYKLTDTLLYNLKSNYGFFLVNYANPDMVGHTGNISASVESIRVVDSCIKKLAEECLEDDICLIITADHGNIEELLDLNSSTIDKEHSTNPIPFLLVARQFERKNPREGGVASLAGAVPVGVLSDIAPTILDLMDMPKPKEMTGISLMPALAEQIE
jgi:2,3-bisphosphoglycerate-independent phosphoglycerate mutase